MPPEAKIKNKKKCLSATGQKLKKGCQTQWTDYPEFVTVNV
jgi:hypothetical protein